MTSSIEFNASKDRYEIHVDGELAGYTEVQESDGTVTFTHTKVFDQFEGSGVAGKLVAWALDDVRSRDKKVVAECEYVAHYIDKHPEYADLVA